MKPDKIFRAAELANQGNSVEAKKILVKILKTSPRNPQALYVLGATHLFEKNYSEAIKHLSAAIKIEPRYVDAISSLGLAYYWTKNFDLAEKQFRLALEIDPNNVDALFKVGTFYKNLGRLEEAKQHFYRALEINPDEVNTLNNLGTAYMLTRDLSKAVEYYRKAFSLDNDNLVAFSNMLSCLRLLQLGDIAQPLVLEKINHPNLGVALFPIFAFIRFHCMWEDTDRILQAMFSYLKSSHVRELDPAIFFEISIMMLSVPEVDDDTLFWMHKTAGHVLEDRRLTAPYSSFPQAMTPAKRWRIGYISPDFRNHAVNTSLRALVNERNRDLFEVYCYSNVADEDNITEMYRAAADAFVNVTLMSDQQLAERIRQDGIHFLVDLAGYTFNGRLAVMAYRPAPVQIVYMGYPYTSGMAEVDYFISDSFLDGPKNASYFTERQLLLPECFTSFDRLEEQVIAEIVPCRRNGYVTFGSLNQVYKLNPKVIGVWARILKEVPDSRLIINHPQCGQTIVRQNLFNEFLKNGIEQDRIIIIWEKHPERSFLRYYNDIDIALDTFPLTGGTTTINAIWMGVPVVTMVGDIYPKRISYSILKNVGIELDDLIAFSEQEYIQKAVALARNPERISELHRLIPESLKTSILCDPVRLTRQIEDAYLYAWDQKYPTRPVADDRADVEYVRLGSSVEIAVESSLDDLTCYVLKEQGGWFDPEYDFVLRLAAEGMNILEVGAGIGIYALPLAIKIGNGTLWAATRTSGEASLLRASAAHNGLTNMKLLAEGDRKLSLDMEMAKGHLSNMDFVRLNISATAGEILGDGARFFNDNSPLVMFGIRRDNQMVDTSLASLFKGMGYEVYRLLPGIKLLVPFVSDDELDAFAINLFACKEDRADALAQQGLLVRHPRQLSELPGLNVKAWQEYIVSLPYASGLAQNWLNTMPGRENWEAYWVALNLFAWAKDGSRNAEDRHACLQTAYGILLMLSQASATLPRLFSFCRILIEMGERETAVKLLNDIYNIIDSAAEISLDEPFLALSDEFAMMNPDGRIAEWLFASVLEQRENLRAFSSYFTGLESLPALEAVKNTGFQTAGTERRIALIRSRHQGPT